MRLVYSTDGSHKNVCKTCSEEPCICPKIEKIDPANVQIKIRLEKNGRAGKIVTVLFNFPNNPAYFTDLCKRLKNNLGSGGTYKDGKIEIQGNHKTEIASFLEKMGFKVKPV